MPKRLSLPRKKVTSIVVGVASPGFTVRMDGLEWKCTECIIISLSKITGRELLNLPTTTFPFTLKVISVLETETNLLKCYVKLLRCLCGRTYRQLDISGPLDDQKLNIFKHFNYIFCTRQVFKKNCWIESGNERHRQSSDTNTTLIR